MLAHHPGIVGRLQTDLQLFKYRTMQHSTSYAAGPDKTWMVQCTNDVAGVCKGIRLGIGWGLLAVSMPLETYCVPWWVAGNWLAGFGRCGLGGIVHCWVYQQQGGYEQRRDIVNGSPLLHP